MSEHQKYEMAIRFVWGLGGVILGLLLGFLIGSGAYFWIALIVIAGIVAAAIIARIRKEHPEGSEAKKSPSEVPERPEVSAEPHESVKR